ncbi:MAG: family 43 glycosylhydrolase [Oscillospiraceae bacterium]|nr:family 43 glycosylhydrolase [Oscillospiraceae bacterium]
MKNKKLVCIIALSALTLSVAQNALTVSAAAYDGDTVYSVTFDEGSGQYTLMEGAELVDADDGKAVKLDGSKNQYVQLADDITDGMTGDYSISFDVYPENEASFARVFDLGSDTGNFMFFTTWGGGMPKFRFKNDDLFSDGVFFKVGEWNHAVITREGTEARLYINGETAATSNTFMNDLGLLGKTGQNYLGKSQQPQDVYFTGMIDNFEIRDYALSEKEVKLAAGADTVEVKVGFIPSTALYTAAYADIKNYKNQPIKCTLINAIYDTDSKLISVAASKPITLDPGETTDQLINTIEKPVDGDTLVSYLYTDISGVERVAEKSLKNEIVVNKLPKDTLENTVGVHDPSIFKDPKSGTYYVYSTGMIDIFKSDDLINWTKTINTLPEVPQCVYDLYKHEDKSQYSNIWAPDMYYDESDTKTPYHLTCSYSDAFGKNNSSIILFKSASPEGPWENGEIIFTSNSDDPELSKVNAIDSNICVDHETGQKYMVYGSFWQGIHIKELNDDYTVKDPDTVGTRIMSRYRGIGGPEGPYIIYNEDTGYYYLFTSFDSLSDTYQIRVARSKSILGPYVDENGNSVDRFDDPETEAKNTYGYKLIGSYQFPMGTTYYGPGHNSVLHDGNNWYLVHHIRTVKNGYATLNVRPMLWNKDGWPVVTPERYQGNDENAINEKDIPGQWDYISIGDNTNAMLTSKKLNMNSDKTVQFGDTAGTWTYGDGVITLNLGDEIITAYVSATYDSDADVPTIQFTGTNQNNVTKWGKKAISSVIYK